MSQQTELCPCGRQQSGLRLSYQTCCQPFHTVQRVAADPETLMRSRYSAFVLKQHQYLIDTHHPKHLNGLTKADLDQQELTQWLGLQVINASNQTPIAQVTFQAWYLVDGHLDAIHEQSDFVFEDHRWWYTTGEQFQAVIPKRNMACICNSGKKFKQCCLAKV
ncbi:YchJ family protein [Shewanella waksmanii]|uniref:YchJ family protein n=1 Tax=Shewanella waksmanii TaxID=213783 RepID=UPI003735C055